MVLDLVGFRDLTVTLGHAAGDHVLKTVARRLSAHRPAGALVGRLDADVFGVVMAAGDERGVETGADHLLAALDPPIAYEDAALAIEASLGVALAAGDDTPADELLRRAELALQTVKAHGGGGHGLYEPRPDATAAGLKLLAGLRDGLRRGDLVAHFQPQVDLRTCALVGAEALARWCRSGEIVSPASFVPVAERSAIIRPLLLEMLDPGAARRDPRAAAPSRRAAAPAVPGGHREHRDGRPGPLAADAPRAARAGRRSTVALGRTLGLRVVAEGVEDGGQARALLLAGCTIAQGWHFGRGVPAHELPVAQARGA
jgi:diguanylate cyclase (GGDEF)-like protein